MSVNKAILLGRVGKDPEIRHLDNDVSVAKFSLATSEKYTKKDGEKVEDTEWHNIIAWKGLAKVAENYIKKGSLVYIEGKTSTRSWDDKGEKKYITEVIAQRIQLLDKKGDGQKGNDAPPPDAPPNINNDSDDDLPF